jgi:IS30 family transposase
MLIRSLLIAAILITACQPTSAQEISKRVLERAKNIEPECDVVEVGCYSFKAIIQLVDRDSRLNVWQLNVWKDQPKTKERISGSLRDGEVVYVDHLFKRNGKTMAYLQYIKEGCNYHPNGEPCGVYGSVDARFLR